MSEDRNSAAAPEPEDLDLDPEDEDLEPADPDEVLDPDEPDPEPRARATESPVSRGSRTVATLRKERQEEREARIRAEAQLEAYRQQPRQAVPQVDPRVEEQQFMEQLRMLSPEDQAMAVGRRVQDTTSRALQAQRLEFADMMDRQSFTQLQRAEPAAKRLSDKVEQLLASERAAGRNSPREVIFNYLLGSELREKAARAGDQQRRTGQRRIAAQTTRPGNSRSTVASHGGRRSADDNSQEAILERSGDIPLW
jgi:hypothetical protein